MSTKADDATTSDGPTKETMSTALLVDAPEEPLEPPPILQKASQLQRTILQGLHDVVGLISIRPTREQQCVNLLVVNATTPYGRLHTRGMDFKLFFKGQKAAVVALALRMSIADHHSENELNASEILMARYTCAEATDILGDLPSYLLPIWQERIVIGDYISFRYEKRQGGLVITGRFEKVPIRVARQT